MEDLMFSENSKFIDFSSCPYLEYISYVAGYAPITNPVTAKTSFLVIQEDQLKFYSTPGELFAIPFSQVRSYTCGLSEEISTLHPEILDYSQNYIDKSYFLVIEYSLQEEGDKKLIFNLREKNTEFFNALNNSLLIECSKCGKQIKSADTFCKFCSTKNQEISHNRPEFCYKCKNKLSNDGSYCAKCGTPISQSEHDMIKEINVNRTSLPEDEPSQGLNILSFFIPIVGLVLYIGCMNTTPKKAEQIGKWAIMGLLATIIASTVYFTSVKHCAYCGKSGFGYKETRGFYYCNQHYSQALRNYINELKIERDALLN